MPRSSKGYIYCVGRKWYYQRPVPVALRTIVGETHNSGKAIRRWRVSLDTEDEGEARRRARRHAVVHDQIIEEAKRTLRMSPGERALATLARMDAYYRAALERLQASEIEAGDEHVEFTAGSRNLFGAMIDRARADARAAQIAEGLALLEDTTKPIPSTLRSKIRAAGGISALVEGAESDRRDEAFLNAAGDLMRPDSTDTLLSEEERDELDDQIASLRARADRARGRRDASTELLAQVGVPGMHASPQRTGGITLQALYERWAAESGVSSDRAAKVEVYIRRYRDLFGSDAEPPTSKARVKEYSASLAKLPNGSWLRPAERSKDLGALLRL